MLKDSVGGLELVFSLNIKQCVILLGSGSVSNICPGAPQKGGSHSSASFIKVDFIVPVVFFKNDIGS